MAKTSTIQTFRTSVAGRQPNTTSSSNLQYINVGELAFNSADKILYTSDGTNLVYVGANQVNMEISGNLVVRTNIMIVNATGIWSTGTMNAAVLSTGFYGTTSRNFYANTTTIFTGNDTVNTVITGNSFVSGNTTSNVNIGYQNFRIGTSGNNFLVNSTHVAISNALALMANGGIGSAGDVLYSNGTGLYWAAPSGGSVNTAAAYTWTNAHVFSGNITIGQVFANGSLGTDPQVLRANSTGGVYWGTVTASATPGGSNTAVQFNDSGAMGGNTYFTYDKVTATLTVNGAINGVTKSFVIDHPTKKNKKLQYACLEGPENGVYVRGRLTHAHTIHLPEYWTKLVNVESITVSLTPIGSSKMPSVGEISTSAVHVLGRNVDCFYHVYGERIDVPKLAVEV